MSKVVLTVDDSKAVREMIAFTMKREGFEIIEAENGRHALNIINGRDIDIIITDINMPEMDGIEFIKALRSDLKYKFVPILMLATEIDSIKKEQGSAAGATGWMEKPFNPEKLVQMINKVI